MIGTVLGAVRKNRLLNKPSNAEVENEIKVWLRQSCDSSGGRRERLLAKISKRKTKDCKVQEMESE